MCHLHLYHLTQKWTFMIYIKKDVTMQIHLKIHMYGMFVCYTISLAFLQTFSVSKQCQLCNHKVARNLEADALVLNPSGRLKARHQRNYMTLSVHSGMFYKMLMAEKIIYLRSTKDYLWMQEKWQMKVLLHFNSIDMCEVFNKNNLVYF